MMAAQPFTSLPHGLEVLIIKASVDPEFKVLLLARRAEVAREIGLELGAAEAAMLAAIPAAQLEATIAQTEVLPESRRVFLGKVAAAMLAALGGADMTGCSSIYKKHSLGHTPEYPIEKYPPAPSAGILARRAIPEFEPIYFDYDKTEIRADQMVKLERALMRINDLANHGRKVQLVGYTDERGSTEYNFSLGERRAKTVYDYLIRNSVPFASLSVLSKGKEAPADPGHTEAAWTQNRRVEFVEIR